MRYVLTLILVCPAWAVVPLTEAQRAQLSTATDFGPRFDEAALYPLLANAAQWTPGDEAGATIPDYAAILQTPADHRGELFLIEGDFAGRAQLIGPLTRSGPWDGKLQEWVLLTDRKADEVAVVYLIDPPTPVDQPPATGAKVRLPARFYKVLHDRDQDGNPTDYLIFVGRGADVITSGSGGSTSAGSKILLLVVILMALCWFTLRKVKRQTWPSSRRTAQSSMARQAPGDGNNGDQEPSGPDESLPEDPAKALDVLHDRHHDEQ